MSKNTKKYRNEWKYIITEDLIPELMNRLSAILKNDSFSTSDGSYDIHSLYFDDQYDRCIRENDAGVGYRFKYRIRYYNEPFLDGFPKMKLERKEKLNGRCYKESYPLSDKEYSSIIRQDYDHILWSNPDSLLQRFATDMLLGNYTPKAIIDYKRCAFVDDTLHIRITIDRNICVSSEASNFTNGNYLHIPIQEKYRNVLEIKFDDMLPGHIRHALPLNDIAQSSFSKYYLGRKVLDGTMIK